MPKRSASRLASLLVALALSAGLAQAYTRAYVVNNTGQAAYSLHVKLKQAAKPGSATSGTDAPIFGAITIGADGLTIDFTNPLDSLGLPDAEGIAAGEKVYLGWLDANSLLPANIESFYWTNAAGQMVGSVQYASPDGTFPPSVAGVGPFFPGGSGLLGDLDLGDGPPLTNTGGDPVGNDPPGGGVDPQGDPNQVPEAASAWLTLFGGAGLALASWRFRR